MASFDSLPGIDDADQNATQASSDETHAQHESPPTSTASPSHAPASDRSQAQRDDDPESADRLTICVTDVTYTVDDQPLIHLFGRDSQQYRWHIEVHGFSPYFYVPADQAPTPSQDPHIVDVEPGYQSVTGTDMVKVTTTLPKHIRWKRDEYDHHEADIPFPDRFLIDAGITSGVSLPRDTITHHPQQHPDDILPHEEHTEHPRPNPSQTGQQTPHTDTETSPSRGTAVVSVADLTPVSAAIQPRVQYLSLDQNPHDETQTASEDSPLVSLTTYDTYTQTYTHWVVAPPATTPAEYEALLSPADLNPLSDTGILSHTDAATNPTIIVCDSEESLLAAYCDAVIRTDPDIITGWGGDSTARTLLTRLTQLADTQSSTHSVSPARLSPVDETWVSEHSQMIRGRVIFDLLDGYTQLEQSENRSDRLTETATRELSVPPQTLSTTRTAWADDPDTYVHSALRTVELTVALNTHNGILPFWDETRRLAGCQLPDATQPGTLIDRYLLHTLGTDYVLPSQHSTAQTHSVTGGHVFEPLTDIVSRVGVLDLKSLYPLIMTTLNASPETKVDPAEFDGPTVDTPTGTQFRTDIDGILSTLVENLLTKRTHLRDKRDTYDRNTPSYNRLDRQQAATKLVMNALYGTFAWQQFRLYDPAIADAVTATGRQLLKHTAATARSLGFSVVYGDSDSILVQFPPVTLSQHQSTLTNTDPTDILSTASYQPQRQSPTTQPTPEEIGAALTQHPSDQLTTTHSELVTDTGTLTVPDTLTELTPTLSDHDRETIVTSLAQLYWLTDQLNASYDAFATDTLGCDSHEFTIEPETLYWNYLQAGKKKRYAGTTVWTDGEFTNTTDITGFACVQSNTAPLTATAQRTVIELLLTDRTPELHSYVQALITAVRNGDVDPWQLAIPERIHKPLEEYDNPTAHQRGALYGTALFNTTYHDAIKPRRLYLAHIDPEFWERTHAPSLDPRTHPTRYDRFQQFKRNQDVITITDPAQLPPEFTVDYERMLDKTLTRPLTRVLAATDLNWDTLTPTHDVAFDFS